MKQRRVTVINVFGSKFNQLMSSSWLCDTFVLHQKRKASYISYIYISYIHQSVPRSKHTLWGNDCCLFWDSHKIRKYYCVDASVELLRPRVLYSSLLIKDTLLYEL